jgi:hypothetical protein
MFSVRGSRNKIQGELEIERSLVLGYPGTSSFQESNKVMNEIVKSWLRIRERRRSKINIQSRQVKSKRWTRLGDDKT